MTASETPVEIPSLRGLGTTWYRRGPRYWLRRALGAAVWLAVLAFCVYIALVLYGSFRSALPPAVRPVWDWAQATASLGALVWGWLVQRRDHRRKLLDPPAPDEFRAAERDERRSSTGRAVAGRAFWLIAAPVLPASAAWAVGWSVAAFTVRTYPSEVGARRWLAVQNGQSGTS
ncbi:hypothetical protein ACWC0C_35485 [Streptomyces sp. NPDC001709]